MYKEIHIDNIIRRKIQFDIGMLFIVLFRILNPISIDTYPCNELVFNTVPDKLCLSKVSPNSFNSSNAFVLLSIFSSSVLVTSSIKLI